MVPNICNITLNHGFCGVHAVTIGVMGLTTLEWQRFAMGERCLATPFFVSLDLYSLILRDDEDADAANSCTKTNCKQNVSQTLIL